MRRAILLPLLAMGCAAAPHQAPQDPADAPQERGTGQACDAGRAKALVGRSRTAQAEGEARRLTGAAAVRWVPQGGMVTMDYRPDRLNIRLDKNGRVLSLDCG